VPEADVAMSLRQEKIGKKVIGAATPSAAFVPMRRNLGATAPIASDFSEDSKEERFALPGPRSTRQFCGLLILSKFF